MTKPYGSRISSASIGKQPLVPDQLYMVAANSYVAGDPSYPAIADAPLRSEYGTCEQTLRRYIAKGTFSEAAEAASLVCALPAVAGDLDGDGQLSLIDAQILYRYASERMTLTLGQTDAADLNDSGTIDMLDAFMLYLAAAGQLLP